ncbi:helix-hairpin-helix domain-containing protein [Jeotgalibacillus haloalkalitolerans]|uniref:Helix-hairpin-helix domain-containing protein n=1 Tax=Jeotgalibacillus haloalkalitolerans TaxID=3104292 RepID=A0ABU5KMC3_9BACL|nr:helix-hairpin-helix domain-containing protein [Jeotgalibacillus sp. HH7-29]MDZ5712289.1 helix-hairpin-helix domain-containing protein [Jeotgalibacillus sp. HH7-29]
MLLWIKNYQKPLFIFIPLITLLCFFLFNQSTESSVPVESPLNNEITQASVMDEPGDMTASVLFVDIKGKVANEGVYEMEQGDRVIDLIQKAGGELPDADMTAVNLAQMLHDEMVIIVPGKPSEQKGDLSTQSDKININRATQTELESITGIGPSKATAIIQYREENGPFKSIEDIMNISGIGEKTFDKLKESISTY